MTRYFITVAGNEAVAGTIAGDSLTGDVVTIGFRPEDVQVAATESGSGVEGVVEHIAIATGGQRLLNLRSGDLRLKAKLPWSAGGGIRAGDAIRWTVSRERVRRFNADEVSVTVANARANGNGADE